MKEILLSDLVEIDRSPLPNLDQFIIGFIQFLSGHPKHDSHLIDAFFVKDGKEEIKRYAYEQGDKHPSVFLCYYEFAKEDKSAQANRLNIILEGIPLYHIPLYLLHLCLSYIRQERISPLQKKGLNSQLSSINPIRRIPIKLC